MIQHGYLAHHGILGQKWGVRRFENADGTLTEAGKKRYYDSNGRLTKSGAKSEHWKKKRDKMFDRSRDLEDEYDKKISKETYSALVKAARKAERDDSDKSWDDYYKKFDVHEKTKATYVGKKLVQEFGEADVDNYINNFSKYANYKVEGKNIVDRYVKRFEADYDTYF